MKGFFSGFLTPLKGIGFFFKNKSEFKKSFLASMIINIILIILIVLLWIYGISSLLDYLVDLTTSSTEIEEDSIIDSQIAGLSSGIKIGLYLILFFILPYLFTALSMMITSTFASGLFTKVRKLEGFEVKDKKTLMAEVKITLRSIGFEIWKLLFILAINFVLLWLNIIPVIGQVLFVALDIYFISIFIAWDNITPYFEEQGFNYKTQKSIIKKNRMHFLGLGLSSFLLLYIPVLQILFAYTNIISSARLILLLEKDGFLDNKSGLSN